MIWTQQSELQFINNLRTVRVVEGYLASLPHRSRWFPGVNVPALRAAAEKGLGAARKVAANAGKENTK